jgi:sporulation and spore germination protein
VRRSAIVALSAILLTACRTQEVRLIPASELPQDVYGPASETQPVGGEGIPEQGTVFLVSKGRLTPVDRELPLARTFPEALVEALLEVEGPVENTDLNTAIPRNTRLISIQVDQNVATVDLSAEFETGATGVPLALRLAQVVYTLTQEETQILNVLFSIEGGPIPVLTGEGGVVDDRPVTRQDYDRFAPKQPERPGAPPTPSPGG